MTPFDTMLDRLKARISQIAAYHQVREDDWDCQNHVSISHYTNWAACQAMLEGIRSNSGITLWAGDSNCLNDAAEGQAMLMFAAQAGSSAEGRAPSEEEVFYVSGRWPRSPADFERKEPDHPRDVPFLTLEEWGKLRQALGTVYGMPRLPISHPKLRSVQTGRQIISFCREIDRLDLWRTYGDKAEGVSFVMPLLAAVRAIRPPWKFYRVAYDERSMARAWTLLCQPLEAAAAMAVVDENPLETTRRTGLIQRELSRLFFLFKHEQFRSEREIRLVFDDDARPTPDDGLVRTYFETAPFFMKSPGCSVILGPKAPKRNERAAWLMATLRVKLQTDTPVVQHSGVPFQ